MDDWKAEMSGSSKAARRIFDLAVLVAAASAVWLGVDGNWDGVVRFVLIAGFMVAARAADVPPPFAAAFAVFLLLATWASAEHWYRSITQFDVLVHFLTPGSLAAVAYYVLVHQRLLPGARDHGSRWRSSAPVLWVTAVGVTAAVVWEFYELIVEQIAPSTMSVGYVDTVVDLAAGMLGSAVAGALVIAWARQHTDSQETIRRDTAPA